MRAPGGLVGVVGCHVEAGEPERGGDREHHRGEPAERTMLVKRPEIEKKSGRHAKVDEIGEGVELRAKPRRAVERARDAPVETIKNGGDDDGDDGEFELAFRREADCRQSEA